jgi:hypothetical protein
MILLLAALAASGGRLTLIEETFRLAPGELRTVDLSLRQRAAVVEIDFRTAESDAAVSVGLRGPEGAEGASRRSLVRVMREQTSGSIRYPARLPGDYQVVVENPRHRGRAVSVVLRVALGFEEPGTLRPATLPPERRRLVVTLSLLFFLLVVFWSGRRLLEAIGRRRRDERFPPF